MHLSFLPLMVQPLQEQMRIYNGRKSADTLGVYVKDKKLVVNLAYKTSRFMDLVTQPVFFPLNQKFEIACGTYKESSISDILLEK